MSEINTRRMKLKRRLAIANQDRYGFLACENCRQKVSLVDMHEIVPRSAVGGKDWQAKNFDLYYNEVNCILLCRTCHAGAGSMTERARMLSDIQGRDKGLDVLGFLDDLDDSLKNTTTVREMRGMVEIYREPPDNWEREEPHHKSWTKDRGQEV